MGYSLSALSNSAPELLAITAHQALDLVATSHLRIDITDVLPLNQAIEAHRRIETRNCYDKNVARNVVICTIPALFGQSHCKI
jgi:NADPH:quinone reductase